MQPTCKSWLTTTCYRVLFHDAEINSPPQEKYSNYKINSPCPGKTLPNKISQINAILWILQLD